MSEILAVSIETAAMMMMMMTMMMMMLRMIIIMRFEYIKYVTVSSNALLRFSSVISCFNCSISSCSSVTSSISLTDVAVET